jgi:hypothetical protein
MTNRKTILSRLLEKKAQIPETVEPQIDKATADKMANEIFDKIFDDVYQKVLSEL